MKQLNTNIIAILVFCSAVWAAETFKMKAGPAGFSDRSIKSAAYSLPGDFSRLALRVTGFDLGKRGNGKFIGEKGIRIDVPEDAFNIKDKSGLRLEIIEVLDPIDFLIAGLPMYTHAQEGGHALTSGGMVYLRFTQNNREVPLSSGKSVRVQFPDLFPQQNFDQYRLIPGRGWQRSGPVETTEAAANNDEQEIWGVGSRSFSAFKTGWLNLDYPEPQIACLKGKISGANAKMPIIVSSVGTNHRSFFSVYVSPGEEFRINVLRSKAVKLIAMQGKNQLGFSDEIITPNQTGFQYDYKKGKDTCVETQEIKLQQAEKSVFESPEKLAEVTGLKVYRPQAIQYKE